MPKMYPDESVSHDPRIEQHRVDDQPTARLTPHQPPTRYGYARCATSQADLRAAVTELQQYDVDSDHIYIDRGDRRRATRRAELQRLLAQLQPGDTLVAAHPHRLARSHHDLAGITDTVTTLDGTIEIAGQPLQTLTATELLHLSAQLAVDLARDTLTEQAEYQSRRDGISGGQRQLSPAAVMWLRELFDAGLARNELPKLFAVSRATLYRAATTPPMS